MNSYQRKSLGVTLAMCGLAGIVTALTISPLRHNPRSEIATVTSKHHEESRVVITGADSGFVFGHEVPARHLVTLQANSCTQEIDDENIYRKTRISQEIAVTVWDVREYHQAGKFFGFYTPAGCTITLKEER